MRLPSTPTLFARARGGRRTPDGPAEWVALALLPGAFLVAAWALAHPAVAIAGLGGAVGGALVWRGGRALTRRTPARVLSVPLPGSGTRVEITLRPVER